MTSLVQHKIVGIVEALPALRAEVTVLPGVMLHVPVSCAFGGNVFPHSSHKNPDFLTRARVDAQLLLPA